MKALAKVLSRRTHVSGLLKETVVKNTCRTERGREVLGKGDWKGESTVVRGSLGHGRRKTGEKIPSHVVTIRMTSDDRAEGNGSYVGTITTWLSPYTGMEAHLPFDSCHSTWEVPALLALQKSGVPWCWTALPPAGTSW